MSGKAFSNAPSAICLWLIAGLFLAYSTYLIIPYGGRWLLSHDLSLPGGYEWVLPRHFWDFVLPAVVAALAAVMAAIMAMKRTRCLSVWQSRVLVGILILLVGIWLGIQPFFLRDHPIQLLVIFWMPLIAWGFLFYCFYFVDGPLREITAFITAAVVGFGEFAWDFDYPKLCTMDWSMFMVFYPLVAAAAGLLGLYCLSGSVVLRRESLLIFSNWRSREDAQMTDKNIPISDMLTIAGLCFFVFGSIVTSTSRGYIYHTILQSGSFNIKSLENHYPPGVFILLRYDGILPAVCVLLAGIIAARMAVTESGNHSLWRNGVFIAAILTLMSFWLGLQFHLSWITRPQDTFWISLPLLVLSLGYLYYVFIFQHGPVRSLAAILGAATMYLCFISYSIHFSHAIHTRIECPGMFILYSVASLAIIALSLKVLIVYLAGRRREQPVGK